MNAIRRVALAAAALLVAAQASAQAVGEQQRQSIERAVRAVQAEMQQAAAARDVAALYARVLDTDTPPIIEDGRLRPTHAAALAVTAAGLRGVASLSYHYTRDHVTVISPSAALWVAEGTGTAILDDGRELSAPFAETLLFVLRDGQWKVLHAHRSVPNPGQ